MTRRERIRRLEIGRHLSPTVPVSARPLQPLFRLQNHSLARAPDVDFISLKAKLFWKTHRLASTIPKKLRRSHGHD